MSHELRTPLNAILGCAQLMEHDPNTTSSQHEKLKIISRSGEHLLRLINDVLEISKIEAGKLTLAPSNFGLHRLLESVETMVRIRAASKGLQLSFELDPEIPQFVRTDEGKLRQVLINLLINAIKFTDMGRVSLRAGVVEQDTESAHLWFEVSDTGQGIEANELSAIFAAFVQSERGRNSGEGAGLGLAISRQFVSLMGGQLGVNSERGRGSTFSFDIRVELVSSLDKPVAALAQRILGIEPGQSSYRILVVDDHWESRELLLQLLLTIGIEARAAINGQEAIEICRSWQPHLVFMDMQMPVMDGYEATRAIKSDPDIVTPAVIALTASAFEHEKSSVLEAGCDDFVTKPFREEIICSKLTEFLGMRFVSDMSSPELVTNRGNQPILSAAALKSLPPDLLERLEDGAEAISAIVVRDVTHIIRQDNPEMADLLDDLVAKYRFDHLQALVKSAKEQI